MSSRRPQSQLHSLVQVEAVANRIFLIRGQKIMLSTDLAAVKRNLESPEDFMFQLSAAEFKNLKSQIVTSTWGGIRRADPYAFTDEGVAMLSSVLRSKRAVLVNIAIMRAFVRLREMLAGHHELAQKLAHLGKKYDVQFKVVFDAIRNLMKEQQSDNRQHIGFRPAEKKRR